MVDDDVFPDRSMELRDKFAWMIETNGWLLEPVPARTDIDPPIPGYSYTIGFEQTFGFPEVLIVGLKPVHARGLAGLLADMLRGGTQIPVGELFRGLYDGEQRAALLPVEVEPMLDMFTSATAWYRDEPFRVVQLAWPDRVGWLPWESGFDPALAAVQLVLGDPPA
ncbi:DUF4262 domain-containing protein [Aquihabitans sp. G128]|uniref:DUF4262 domain-containing protein n=1 Tax=Aquihabitans sp. G128 TaxID=2849779 RepID=UPI001C214213|nr:DUF4262 domain-containing protein [Aquihabitans sp. G128]QXC62938.1 DUF4262 domain-containing protein [Aquihabitans sp. G128]